MSFADLLKQVETLENKESDESEPYKFKYEARELLLKNEKEYETKINNKNEFSKLEEKDQTQLTTEHHIIKFHLAMNYITTEERSQGTPLLSDVVTYFRASKHKRIKYCFILLQSLNYLAIIMSSRGESQKSKKYLDQGEELYIEVSKSRNNKENIFDDSKENLNKFEREYTQTLFYFAQIYLNIGNSEKSAQYSQKTLQRQLFDRDILDRRDWTRNALGLSQYYIMTHKYRQGVHCIEAACKIAPEFKKDDEDDEQLKADIEKGWGLLYSEILKNSFEIMLEQREAEEENKNNKEKEKENENDKKKEKENENSEKKNDNKNDKKDEKSEESKQAESAEMAKTKQLADFEAKVKCDNTVELFTNIRMKPPPEMSLATTFAEAKELFVPGLKHLMAALNFYILDGFVTDHVKIAQDISKLYKYLAFFEKDRGTKCKMHKRRINLLKEIEEQLAPHAYSDIVQELCHELGVIHDEMASIKKEMLFEVAESGQLAQNADVNSTRTKINALYSKAIGYFTKFVQIYEFPPDRPMSVGTEAEAMGAIMNTNSNDPKDKDKLPKIDEEYRHEYLEGHFMLAAIYSKFLHNDAAKQVESVRKSLNGYQHVVRFYDSVGGVPGFETQYQISVEMAKLLPLKLNQMQS